MLRTHCDADRLVETTMLPELDSGSGKCLSVRCTDQDFKMRYPWAADESLQPSLGRADHFAQVTRRQIDTGFRVIGEVGRQTDGMRLALPEVPPKLIACAMEGPGGSKIT